MYCLLNVPGCRREEIVQNFNLVFSTVIILGKYGKQSYLSSGAYRVLINLLARMTFFTDVGRYKKDIISPYAIQFMALSTRNLDQNERDKLFFPSHLNKAI